MFPPVNESDGLSRSGYDEFVSQANHKQAMKDTFYAHGKTVYRLERNGELTWLQNPSTEQRIFAKTLPRQTNLKVTGSDSTYQGP
jgi:hypothetical protein